MSFERNRERDSGFHMHCVLLGGYREISVKKTGGETQRVSERGRYIAVPR